MNKPANNNHSISLQSTISDCEKLSQALADYINDVEIPDESYNDIRLVIEEIFVNIASYAYSESEHRDVTIEFSHSPSDFSITFTDTGIAFNPLTDAEEYKDKADHCDGGMGLRLITSLTDVQQYNRVGQSNVFTVTKHYTK